MFPYFAREGLSLVCTLTIFISTAFAQTSLDSTLLVIASSNDQLQTASAALRGYGTPYQTLLSSGNLPALNTSATAGKFGGFIYEGTGLSAAKLQQIYDYQTVFGARLVRYNVNPTSDNFGTALVADGCCDTNVEQLVSFTNTSAFSLAGLKLNAGISTQNLWHYPGRITDPSIAWEIASYAPAAGFTSKSTAAVVNRIGAREQMVWFLPFEAVWSQTSNLLMHSWVHFLTRSLYTGYRRVNFLNQVDDVFLATGLFSPANTEFRTRPGDMAAHMSWQSTLQAKMNSGSSFFIELAHNGNGNIQNGSASNSNTCAPGAIVWAVVPPLTDPEFIKPLGTGIVIWPSTPTSYVWTKGCNDLDPLEQWFQNANNRNAFGHLTHTFTHIYLNNATYNDAAKEISINRKWMDAVGISGARIFSGKGIVPPAITGMHNGDVIKAWVDNGLTSAVGDNSRSALLNKDSEHWPLITNTADNGYSGFPIIGRYSSNIYFNCDKPACIEAEYKQVAGSSASFASIMDGERTANTRNLFALRRDPYMFHQANMRQIDMGTISGGGVSGQYSLIQLWTEVIVKEFTKYVDWPMITLKHDDIAAAIIARRNRDLCTPKLSYVLSSAGNYIEAVTVSAGSGSCGSSIPVTFPADVTDRQSSTAEKIGNDPLTLWVNFSTGGSKTFKLSTPIPIAASNVKPIVATPSSTSSVSRPTTTIAPSATTSAAPSSTATICGTQGWDKSNPAAFWYDESGLYKTQSTCRNNCINTQKAVSYGQGGNTCACYSKRLDGNVTPSSAGPLKFWDKECAVAGARMRLLFERGEKVPL